MPPRNFLEWLACGNMPKKRLPVRRRSTSRGRVRFRHRSWSGPGQLVQLVLVSDADCSSDEDEEDHSETSDEDEENHSEASEKTSGPKKVKFVVPLKSALKRDDRNEESETDDAASEKAKLQEKEKLRAEEVKCICTCQKCKTSERKDCDNNGNKSLGNSKDKDESNGQNIKNTQSKQNKPGIPLQTKQQTLKPNLPVNKTSHNQSASNNNNHSSQNSNNCNQKKQLSQMSPRPVPPSDQDNRPRLLGSCPKWILREDVYEIQSDPRPNAFYDGRKNILRVYHGSHYGNDLGTLHQLAKERGRPLYPTLGGEEEMPAWVADYGFRPFGSPLWQGRPPPMRSSDRPFYDYAGRDGEDAQWRRERGISNHSNCNIYQNGNRSSAGYRSGGGNHNGNWNSADNRERDGRSTDTSERTNCQHREKSSYNQKANNSNKPMLELGRNQSLDSGGSRTQVNYSKGRGRVDRSSNSGRDGDNQANDERQNDYPHNYISSLDIVDELNSLPGSWIDDDYGRNNRFIDDQYTTSSNNEADGWNDGNRNSSSTDKAHYNNYATPTWGGEAISNQTSNRPNSSGWVPPLKNRSTNQNLTNDSNYQCYNQSSSNNNNHNESSKQNSHSDHHHHHSSVQSQDRGRGRNQIQGQGHNQRSSSNNSQYNDHNQSYGRTWSYDQDQNRNQNTRPSSYRRTSNHHPDDRARNTTSCTTDRHESGNSNSRNNQVQTKGSSTWSAPVIPASWGNVNVAAVMDESSSGRDNERTSRSGIENQGRGRERGRSRDRRGDNEGTRNEWDGGYDWRAHPSGGSNSRGGGGGGGRSTTAAQQEPADSWTYSTSAPKKKREEIW